MTRLYTERRFCRFHTHAAVVGNRWEAGVPSRRRSRPGCNLPERRKARPWGAQALEVDEGRREAGCGAGDGDHDEADDKPVTHTVTLRATDRVST